MNGFTSGKRAARGMAPANHDPRPWLVAGGRYAGRYVSLSTIPPQHFVVREDPRPEFEVLDNPILVDLREDYDNIPDAVEQYISLLDGHYGEPSTGPKHVHARRVLAKLAAIA